eukprot:12562835-Alexandrium_andersonii.AAC.1
MRCSQIQEDYGSTPVFWFGKAQECSMVWATKSVPMDLRHPHWVSGMYVSVGRTREAPPIPM